MAICAILACCLQPGSVLETHRSRTAQDGRMCLVTSRESSAPQIPPESDFPTNMHQWVGDTYEQHFNTATDAFSQDQEDLRR